jgi:hypothetical protein
MPALLNLTVSVGHGVKLASYCCVSVAQPTLPPARFEPEVFSLINRIRGPRHFVVCTNWQITKELVQNASFRLIETAWERKDHHTLDYHYWYVRSGDSDGQKPEVWIRCGDKRVHASCMNAFGNHRCRPSWMAQPRAPCGLPAEEWICGSSFFRHTQS